MVASVQVRVRVFGADAEFVMPADGSTVLQAARAAGVELPSSCEAGVCSTCRGRLLAGRVELLNEGALDAAERAAGFVLACQAVPCSAAISLEFD